MTHPHRVVRGEARATFASPRGVGCRESGIKPTAPEIGPVISPALMGTLDDSTATVNLTFPSAGLFFLEARATFTLP